jgi:hypothetical protein
VNADTRLDQPFDYAVEAANLRRRVLLLGFDLGWAPVNSFSAAPGDPINVADFDVVVINIDRENVAASVEKAAVARLLASGGGLFVVGAPDGLNAGFLPGGAIQVRREAVETVVPVEHESFRRLFPALRRMQRADYVVARPLPPTDDAEFVAANSAHAPGTTLFLTPWQPLAVGRQGDPIAFGLTAARVSNDNTPAVRLGGIVWLGRPSVGTAEELVEVILADLYSRRRHSERPAWMDECALPKRESALAAEAEARRIREVAEADLAARTLRAEREACWEPLLYADGSELEDIVFNAVAELGATASRPRREGTQDIDLTTPRGSTFVVEVKGATGSLKVANLRQAADWRLRAIEHGARGVRSLVVANPLRGLDPRSRSAAESFPTACMEAATPLEVTVVSTRQIYEALRHKQLGDDPQVESFWTAIEVQDHGFALFPEFLPQ